MNPNPNLNPNRRLRYISIMNDTFQTKQSLLFYRGETVLDSTVLVSKWKGRGWGSKFGWLVGCWEIIGMGIGIGSSR